MFDFDSYKDAFVPYAEANALVTDAIERRHTVGIPTACINIMQHSYIDRLAGAPIGSYQKDPRGVYLAMSKNIGVRLIDQFIPENPLELGDNGYESKTLTATTGAERIELDGIVIDSPESVAEHMERFTFPALREKIAAFDEDRTMRNIMDGELAFQKVFGDSILKTGYAFVHFPYLEYYAYGYENYFAAYALYPEVIEKCFALQADYALLNNNAAAKLYEHKLLPPLYRLDHDMADSRGTLVDIKSLDKIWTPHFARCVEPLVKSGVNLIWHCDGNLSAMLPRLLDAGVKGFQGFQYEDGMDYKKICAMKTRDGDSPIIWAGVSVTRTLPFGTPRGVRDELKFLVENGPEAGLFLGASSSVVPGVRWENIRALVDGLKYYGERGRK